MKPSDPPLPTCDVPLPESLRSRLTVLADLFTRPTWQHALLLLVGAVLAPGRRTVAAALRILGREHAEGFSIYHQVLNRAR